MRKISNFFKIQICDWLMNGENVTQFLVIAERWHFSPPIDAWIVSPDTSRFMDGYQRVVVRLDAATSAVEGKRSHLKVNTIKTLAQNHIACECLPKPRSWWSGRIAPL